MYLSTLHCFLRVQPFLLYNNNSLRGVDIAKRVIMQSWPAVVRSYFIKQYN